MTGAGPDRRSESGAAQVGASVLLRSVVHLYRSSDEEVVALRGIDLDIDPGEMLAMLGPSGMGKTTVLRLMAGLMVATAGSVQVDGRDLARMSARERRALRAGPVSHIVQGAERNLLPFATALQNVWFAQHGARARGHAPPWEPSELLGFLHLDEVADRPVAELPRGLQQQVAVAAGAASGPRLLLADEPTAQLSDEAGADVIGLLRQINADLRTTVVVVTHEPQVARRFSRTVTIRDGRVGAEGRHGEEFAVVDGSGSVQLPPDVLEILPPNTRVRVVRGPDGVELRRPEREA